MCSSYSNKKNPAMPGSFCLSFSTLALIQIERFFKGAKRVGC